MLLSLAVVALGSEPLTNEIIIKMVQSGVPTETVIRTIQSAESFRFGTLPGDLMQLQQANVPEEVVRALAARINWPGSPVLVIAHPIPASAPAAAPQKPSKGKAAPAKARQPVPVQFPAPPPTATASIGAPVATALAVAAPASDPLQAVLTQSAARGHGRSLRTSTGRAFRRFWSFGFLRRLFRH